MASPEPARRRRRRFRLSHEGRILLTALCAGLGGVLTSMIILWTGNYTPKVQWTLTLFIVGSWLAFAFAVRGSVARPLQTLANMQAALREGDFTVRARGAGVDDSLGELMREVNQLSETLREQRLGALEAGALLTKVMTEIDVAVFTFDDQSRLRLVNRAGERLLAAPAERLLVKRAEQIGLASLLEGEAARTVEHHFPGKTGRFALRRSVFRQGGVPHHLVVITDLSRALREEERQAWQRLVRVLGHELNNSLTPVKSIAESLESILKREQRHADWEEDMKRGLRVIVDRSEALTRFMKEYARLARLPQPKLQEVDLGALVYRVAGLEQRLPVRVEPGPELHVSADPDQLEQLLINGLRNAVDASLETGGGVSVSWSKNHNNWELIVRDEGHGITNPANLFVPFFSTKPGGSGIGLALSRQIAEGHGGTVTLLNRDDRPGCEFHLRLPLAPA